MQRHTNYWARYTRTNRRRFLGGTAALGAGTAGMVLVGCGGDDDDDDDSNGASGDDNGNGSSSEDPTEASSEGEEVSAGETPRGGVTRAQIGVAPAATLDPMISPGPAGTHHSMSLNRLVKYVTSVEEPGQWAAYELEGDLAESWEWTDETTLTFQIRNARTHDKEPLNGREMTAEDCRMFFEAYMEDGLEAAEYALVDGIESPDDRTLTFHLSEPRTYFQAVFAYPGAAWVTPPEILDDEDLRENGPFGAGPFMLDRYEPENGFFYTAHPDFYDSDLPYLDGAELYIIGETQTIVSNMRSGELDFATGVEPNQAQQFADSDDFTVMTIPSPWSTTLGPSPRTWTNDEPPFNDQRVRQAVQMGVDYEGIINAVFDGHAGIPGPVVPAASAPFWGLPEDDPAREWLTFDPERARSLLEEAGFEGEQFDLHYNLGYGQVQESVAEAVAASLSAVGFSPNLVPYQDAQWDSDVYFNDQWSGLGITIFPSFPDAGAILSYHLDPSTTTISISHEVSELIDQVREQSQISDHEERISITQDVLRVVAEQGYFPPSPWGNTTRVVNNRVVNFHNSDHYAMGRDTVARYGLRDG